MIHMQGIVILFDGFEEIEAITAIDVLRRANINLSAVSLSSSIVEGSHGIKIVADRKMNEINTDHYDFLILPGGSGYKNILNSRVVHELLNKFNKQGKLIASICASSLVLEKAGVLEGKTATTYPGLERELSRPRDQKVVFDKNIITSKAPGTAIDFALKIVEVLLGKLESDRIRMSLVFFG